MEAEKLSVDVARVEPSLYETHRMAEMEIGRESIPARSTQVVVGSSPDLPGLRRCLSDWASFDALA
jgi:hypothetical protein